MASRPVRGAWIETYWLSRDRQIFARRAPCGARGLKRETRVLVRNMSSESRPVRGAWIETATW